MSVLNRGFRSGAENPGAAKFSYKKYYPIRKLIFKRFIDKFNSDMCIQNVSAALMYGDTQPAIVCSVDPLLIAAYSDEMDAVVMLQFPSELVSKHSLTVGTKLVTSNTYKPNHYDSYAKDIFAGKFCSGLYSDFMPIVQLFIAKNDEKIMKRTELFDADRWNKVEALAFEYLKEHPDMRRDGFFYLKVQ